MTEPVLNAALKLEIQQGYSAWLEARGFRARRGQREMIAQVARVLTGDAPRILVVEAGTGTGKTAGYCLPAIPIARALGKTVIISTATVALQEQVVLRDLPDLQRHAGVNFSFALAKGRGRYLCLKRLDDRLRSDGQNEIPLFESVTEEGAALYQAMLGAFADKRWDGELDSWEGGISEALWRPVTTDHRGCSNTRCGFFRQCPFFRARATAEGVDVVVANHDLLLADLSLGGGAVLPAPEDSIYVLDEAHHLPDKTQQHFAASARLLAAAGWVDHLNTVLGSMAQRFARVDMLVDVATRLSSRGGEAQDHLRALHEAVGGLDFQVRDASLATARLPMGRIPPLLQELAAAAIAPVADLHTEMQRLHATLQEVLAGDLKWPNAHEAEDWLPVIGQQESRAAALLALLRDFSGGAGDGGHPHGEEHARVYARWANRHETDLELVSAPLEPGHLLKEHLWDRCFGALCTSATLAALGSFDRFFERAGLDAVPALRIPSPFNYPDIATFAVPELRSDPRDFRAHSDEVAELLPELLQQEPSGLVLFTSWRQLHEVQRLLPAAFLPRLKVQGEGSKQALLAAHRADVDAGRPSVLVGLASFAEGVDLPDDYCRHVVIVKLPFAVPEDPLDQAMAEWAESRGRNAFFDIAVPDAALKLIQACGRLIRHERDYGRITLLDRRILTQRYGRTLLESLPPFRREFGRVSGPQTSSPRPSRSGMPG